MRHQVSRLLLLSGADQDARTDYYDNAPLLCVAAGEGHTEVTRQLMECGADVECTGDDGVCALASAARCGLVDIMRLLINGGARVSYVTAII
jgi:ankyrin repeat protein